MSAPAATPPMPATPFTPAARSHLERPLPPSGPPPATVAVTLCFVAAVAGVLAASRLPAWFGYAAVGAAVLGLGLSAALGGLRRPAASALLRPCSLALAVLGLMAGVEQSRQWANQAVTARLFRDAPAPYAAAGFAADPALAAAVERDPPRLRVARIVGVIEEAPPPPLERHRLSGQPRVYRLRTESVSAPAAAPMPIVAEIRVAVRDDPRLQTADFFSTGDAAEAAGGAVAFAEDRGAALYPLPGDRVEATVLLSELDPGQAAARQFDAPLQWVLSGVHARTTIDPRQWRRLPAAGGGGVSLVYTARRMQLTLSTALNRHLHGRAADTLRALCWGDTSDLTVEDRAAFQRTGTVHLLAISGLHVYILLYLLFRLTSPLLLGGGGAGRLLRLAVVTGLLWLFAALTGFQEPVVRAVGMFTLWVGARAVERRFDALNALALCGLAVLFVSPGSAHRIGFQLSYLSVGLLCWWGPALSEWLGRQVLGRLERWLLPRAVAGLSQALAAGLIALFATLPLTVYAFGIAPAWALLANLIMIPLIELLLIAALPLAVLLVWIDPGWVSQGLQFAADRVLAAADGLSALCGSAADTPPPPGWALPLCWLALLWAGAYLRRAVQPTLALGALGVRRRFGYPATGLALGFGCCAVLALSGRWLPGAVVGGAPPAVGWAAVSAPPPVLILGRLQPCVLAQPVSAAAAAVADGAVTALAVTPPDRPEAVETLLRRPVREWRLKQAPAAREEALALAPAVWWLVDGAEARADLLRRLPPAGGLKSVLLVSLTAESNRSAARAEAAPAALQERVRAVIVLGSAWRLLEADGQAWVDFGRRHSVPVLCADAAAVWRIEADGLGAWVESDGRWQWWPFDAK